MDLLTIALGVCLGNLLYLGVGLALSVALRPMRTRRLAKAQAEQMEAYQAMLRQFDVHDDVEAEQQGERRNGSPYI